MATKETLDLEDEDRFHDFGALGYDDREMRAVLGVTQARLTALKRIGGAAAYARGAAELQFEIDRGLARRAADGDADAVKILELRRARLI